MIVSLLPEPKDTCALWQASKLLHLYLMAIFEDSYNGSLPLLFAASDVHDIRLAMAQLKIDPKCVNNAIPVGGTSDLGTTPSTAVQTALQFAVAKQCPGMVRFLLANGADRHATNWDGKTPLLVAVSSITGVGSVMAVGQLKTVKMLLDHTPTNEADEVPFRVDAVNALFHTAAQGSAEVLTAILESGVDVNTCDSEGRTALFLAHDHKVTDCLLKSGASVTVVDSAGKTVLHHATLSNHDEAHMIVDRLLDRKGIDKDRKDDAGKTARQYASENSSGRTRGNRGPNTRLSNEDMIEQVYYCREVRFRGTDW